MFSSKKWLIQGLLLSLVLPLAAQNTAASHNAEVEADTVGPTAAQMVETEGMQELTPSAPSRERAIGTPAADVAGTGTAHQIPKWLDGTGTLGDSNIYSEPTYGRIGIGTTSPSGQLHIFGNSTQDIFAGMGPDLSTGPSFNFGYAGLSFGAGAGFFNVRTDGTTVAPNPSLRFLTANVQRMIITNLGRIGIGTVSPAYTLDVVGDGHFTQNVTLDGSVGVGIAPSPTYKLYVNGNTHVNGTVTGTVIRAHYQDVAEWVPASTPMTPGTVVVLDPSGPNRVMPSHRAYDTSVAGVVSAQPGVILGIGGDDKEQIATTGRVKVHVDARRAPIRIGDLLVSGDRPGTAMRSEPMEMNGRAFHQPGTIIGKALEELAEGEGEILVLLSLQ